MTTLSEDTKFLQGLHDLVNRHQRRSDDATIEAWRKDVVTMANALIGKLKDRPKQ